MTDKVQKIREEVEKLKSNLIHGACSSQVVMETRCKEEAYNEVLAILDTMQEEPKKCMYAQSKYTNGDRLVLCKDCEELCKYNMKTPAESLGISPEEHEKIVDECLYGKEPELVDFDDMPLDPNIQYVSREIAIKAHAEDYSFNIESELFQQLNKEQQELWRKEIEQACMSGGYCGLNLGLDKRYDKEEPVSEELEEASLEYFKQALKDGDKTKLDAFKAGAKWQEKRLLPMIDKICGMCQKQQDFINSKDLGELISTLSRRYPEVSFAKLSRIAVRVAKWQKEQIMAKAIRGRVSVDVKSNYHSLIYGCWDMDNALKNCNDGDKVKVIVIKED